MGSCVRINPGGPLLACNGASSSSCESSTCNPSRSWSLDCAYVESGRRGVPRPMLSLSCSTCGERGKGRRVAAPAAALNADTSRIEHPQEDLELNDNPEATAVPPNGHFLREDDPSTNSDVDEQLQPSPSKPRRIALFVEPSPFAYPSLALSFLLSLFVLSSNSH